MPRVSIVIPCYNAAPWLGATLESALGQAGVDKEVILVDDGSTDGSLAVAARYEGDPALRIVRQKNAGQSAAFNTGIAAARGEFLEFLDADDLIAPDKIALQLARLGRLPPGWIASGAWGRFYRDPSEAVHGADPVASDLAPVDWLVAVWGAYAMMHGAAWLIPADLVARAGGWNAELSLINDFEFFSRMILASRGVAHCAGARSYYRSGLPGSLSGTRSERAWRSAYESTRLGTERLLAFEESPRTRAACANAWRQLYFDSYPGAPRALRRIARARVRALGERMGRPRGGPRFELLARLFGWRVARILHVRNRARALPR